jgi:integrase
MTVSMTQQEQLTPDKFLNTHELAVLLNKADELFILGQAKKRKALVRDWFLINTAIFTGLRRAEICALKVTDVRIGNGQSHIIVQCGKGGKKRTVHIGKEYKRTLKKYIQWKADNDELTEESYLLRTERSVRYSVSGLWTRWKKHCSKPLHSARHSFGTYAYQSTQNLRLVQKQLGHSKITTTQIYSDVPADIICDGMDAMEKLTKALRRSGPGV